MLFMKFKMCHLFLPTFRTHVFESFFSETVFSAQNIINYFICYFYYVILHEIMNGIVRIITMPVYLNLF